MDKGWVKVHRQIFENHFLLHDEACFALFMKLLLSVGKNKGEISGGKYQLAERFNMNPSKFYRAMLRLEKEGMVNRTVNHKYTVYTICNWSKYQGDSEPQNEPQANHRRTTSEHSNKNKKEEYIKGYLKDDMTEFIKMRKSMRKPMTDKAVELLQKKLESLYPEDHELQVRCLQASIENGWSSVYALKNDNKEKEVVAPVYQGPKW